jgi:hypothetical protein
MLRLRQICLVAPSLEPVVAQVERVFGLNVCHRDEAVAKYGLVNALFVFGHQFIEVVAPTREDTAAGRFLARNGGAGPYMIIFDSDDPERRRAHVEALGLRVAHTLEAPGFRGFQLHPRDARATMLEFDRSDGNEQVDGAYWPAGAHWREHQQLDRVAGLPWVDVQSPAPTELAAHWSRITELPIARDAKGQPALSSDLGALRFVAAEPGAAERITTLHVAVAAPRSTIAAAASAGLPCDNTGFTLCGVRIAPCAS